MPRGISFERFSRAQKEIEGAAEGARKKRKARKRATAEKGPGSQILRTPEEITQETEELVSAESKPKTIEISGKEIKEEHLDIEEEIALKESKELFRAKKKAVWEDEIPRRGHRRGHKPPKVERATIREDTDIEEAA